MSDDPPTRMPNPFVGPRPLLTGEPLFGRDREVRELRNILVAERIVALYSPSGAGKTSLVQAGLIPRMNEADFHVLPIIRVNQPPRNGHGRGWNRYLESALVSLGLGLPPTDEPAALERARFREYLAGRPRPEGEPVAELLVFDQFEEIVTLDPTDGAAKAEFFAQVGEALRDEDLWAVFSLREDHLAALEPFRPFVPTRLAASFRLEFLSRAAAAVAVRRTADHGGVAFTEEAASFLVEDLSRVRVQQADRTVAERVGQDVEPVQLQVVCRRLWDHLPAGVQEVGSDLVRSFGSVGDALGAFYAESVAAVAQETTIPEHEIRAWFDDHLITKQGIRGQVLWERGDSPGLDDRVIQALIGKHLVRAESRRGATWLELAHDRLIEPVRTSNAAWFAANLSPFQRQARLWADEPPETRHLYLLNAEGLDAANRWLADHPGQSLTATEREFLADSHERADLLRSQREAESERRTKRKLALLATALFVVFLAALGAAGYALYREGEQRKLGWANLARGISGAEVPNALHRQNDELAALLARQAYIFEDRSELGTSSQVTSSLNNAVASDPRDRIVGTHAAWARAIAISPDGRFLASGGTDGTVLVWDIETDQPHGLPLTTPEGSPLSALAFSPDGRLLVAGGCRAAPQDPSACADASLRVWDMRNIMAEPVELLGPPGSVRSLAFDPDHGHRLVAGRRDGRFHMLDLADPENPMPTVQLPGPRFADALAIAFSGDGRLFAVGTCTGRGDAGACLGGSVVVYDATSEDDGPRYLTTLYGPADGVLAVALSPDGSSIAGGSGDKRIWVWEGPFDGTDAFEDIWVGLRPFRGIPGVELGAHADVVTSLTWPDAQTLVSASWDGSVIRWNPQLPGADPLRLRSRINGVGALGVAMSPDGQLLATSRSDGSVRLGDPELSASAPTLLADYASEIWSVELRSTSLGRVLAAGAADGQVYLWWLDREGLAPTVLLQTKPIADVREGCGDRIVYALAIDGVTNRLAVGYSDGEIQVWDISNPESIPGQPRYAFTHGGADACVDVRGLAFDPANRDVLASAGWDDGSVRLWELGQSARELPPPPIDVQDGASVAFRALAFNADGSLLAAAGCTDPPPIPGFCRGDGWLSVWDMRTASEPRPVAWQVDAANPDEQFYSVALGPSESGGEVLAMGMLNGAIRVIRVERDEGGARYLVDDDTSLTGHFSWVRELQFSADGSLLYSGSDDATIRRWRFDAPNEPLVLTSLEGPVRAIALDSSGSDPSETLLISGSSLGAVRLWSFDAEEMAAAVCAQTGRTAIEPAEWDAIIGEGVPDEQTCPDRAAAP